MSIIAPGTSPCWEVTHHANGDREWWKHFETSEKALGDLADDLRRARADLAPGETLEQYNPELATSKVIQLKEPCVHLVCDRCGQALGMEGDLVDVASAMHLYGEADAEDWAGNWETIQGRLHFCPDCPVPEDVLEDIEQMDARLPGPNDVPLEELRDWVREGFREGPTR